MQRVNNSVSFQSVPVSYWINPAERLVQNALNKWRMKLMKADNTSCIVVLIDPLGPRKLSILKKKREEQMRLLAEKKGLDNKLATELLTAKESLQKSPKKGKDSKHDSKTSPKPGSLSPGSAKRQVLWNDSTGGMKITTLLKADTSKFSMKPSPMHKFADNLDDSVQLRSTCLISPLLSDKEEPKHANSAPCTTKPRTSPLQNSASENLGRTGMATRQSPHKSPESVPRSPSSGKNSAIGHSARHDPHSKGQQKVSPSKDSHRKGSHSHSVAHANQQTVSNKIPSGGASSNKPSSHVNTAASKTKHENPNSKHVSHNQMSSSKVNQSHSLSTRLTPSALHSTRSSSHNNSASSCPNMIISTHPKKCLQPTKSSDNIKNTGKKIGSLKELENLLTSSNVKLNLKNLNVNKSTPRRKNKNLNNSNASEGSRSVRKCSGTKSLSSRISLRLRRIRQKSLRNRTKVQTENKGFTKGVKRKMDSSADTPIVKKLRHS